MTSITARMHKSNIIKTTWIVLVACLLFASPRTAFTIESETVKENYADFNGNKVYYKSIGNGDTALVFIHGWACNANFWKYQTPVFKEIDRVVLLDLPGHGNSENPDIQYTQDAFSDAVKTVLDDAGVKKAILAGHSMGFSVAAHVIRKYPEQVIGLVIVDGAYSRFPENKEEREKMQAQIDEFVNMLKTDDYEEAVKGFVAPMLTPGTSEAVRSEIINQMTGSPRNAAASATENFFLPDAWKEFHSNIPTLAVYDKSQDYPMDNEEFLRTFLPNMEFHLWEGAGHFFMMTQPERFNNLLINFLKTNF